MSQYRNFFFYIIFANIYIVSFSLDRSLAIHEAFKKVGINYNLSYGGRLKYLTHISLLFQCLYFALSTFNSFYEYLYNKNQPSGKLRNFCNFLYVNIIWPIGTMVTLSFWGIFFVNRDMIYPKPLDEAIPSWQNHVLHTFPIITGLLDSFFTKHTYSKSFLKGILPSVLFALTYVAWTFFIAYHGGFWVYPILKHLGSFYRILFISFMLAVTVVIYKSGEFINNIFWPTKSLIVKKLE